MSWQRVYLAVGLLGVLLLLTNADNSVHILSKYQQLVTSTALNWLPRAYYDSSKEIVIGGFAIEESEGTCNQARELNEIRSFLWQGRPEILRSTKPEFYSPIIFIAFSFLI